MAITITKPDGSPLTGISVQLERGTDTVKTEVKMTNTGEADVVAPIGVLYAEDVPGGGDYVTSGHPVVDELMGRLEITGVDSSGTPGQEAFLGNVQTLGHLAIALLPTIKPGNSILADVWLHQATTSASGGSVRFKVGIAGDQRALAVPLGVTQVATGILTGIREAESFVISGMGLTASGPADAEAHRAAGSWLLAGKVYSDASVRTMVFPQDDGASVALAAGESYIAAVTQSSADEPTVTKGLKGTTPVKPQPPVDEILLAWVTVNYNAVATVIETADIENVNGYGRLLVTAPASGLTATVYPGKALAQGFMQIHAITETDILAGSSTNRIWLDIGGALVVNTSGTPPSAGAHLLATATTDGGAVTSLVDERAYVPGGSTLVPHAATHGPAGSDPLSIATLGGAAVSHTHPQSDITDLVSDLAAKAGLTSPAFIGDPTAPTKSFDLAPGAYLATTQYVQDVTRKVVHPTLVQLIPQPNSQTIAADASALGEDQHIDLLPAGTALGARIAVVKIDSTSHKIIISASSGQSIDGAATYELENQFDAVELVAINQTGCHWAVVGKSLADQAIPLSAAIQYVEEFTGDGSSQPTVAHAIVAGTKPGVFRNGQRIREGPTKDWTRSGQAFTLTPVLEGGAEPEIGIIEYWGTP
jgi:hypothetical protein